MANNRLLKEINAIRCLRALRSSHGLSRSDIGRILSLSRMTVGNAVRSLIEKGLVVETEESASPGGVGRPGIRVRLNPSGGYFVGIDISSSTMNAVLVDLTMKVVAHSMLAVQDISRDTAKMVQQFAVVPGELLQKAGLPAKRLTGVGISVRGIVGTSGRVLSAPYLGWKDLDLQSLVSKRLKSRWPVRVVNDASAFAHSILMERPEKDLRDTLLLLLSEGIGSSQIRQGQIISGAHGFAGEIGHMILGASMKEASSKTFEMLAGYNSLLPALSPNVSVTNGLAALATKTPSPRASLLLERWANAFSVGLLNLIHILDPERIILGGPLAAIYPTVEEHIIAAIESGLVHGFTMPLIEIAESGGDSAAIGAASTIREELFALPELHKL
jgi:predicted NBD/HSP70 family sugar kinase